MENNFVTWLTGELDKRGWSNRELSRRAGVASSAISMIISGQRNPGYEFCVNIARAFKIPPERVMRIAGLLPGLPAPEDSLSIKELLGYIKRLSEDDRLDVLDYAIYRYRRAKGSLSHEANNEAQGNNPEESTAQA